MQHLGTRILETDRLILRPFCVDDAGAMFANWANDPEVTRYLTWPPHSSVDVSREVLRGWISQYDRLDYYSWAIVLRSLGQPIGSIAVVKHDDDLAMVQMGYCIGRQWWRQGLTSEALQRLVRFFFDEVGVNRLEATHDPRNPHSGQVMRKSGLRYEGTMRQAARNNQGLCDSAIYAILAADR